MYRFFCRAYQFAFRTAAHFLPWRQPVRVNSVGDLAAILEESGISRVLLVTDKGVVSLGLHKELLESLERRQIYCTVFDETVPNPTIANIEKARVMYLEHKCGGIIALGGGSPMDCAKAVGARIARPGKSIPRMKGQLKVLKKIPVLAAIPTTSGTGSEATLAAVVTNGETREKYAINDHALIPRFAVLDPSLTQKLPPPITAQTGMDALCHAVEAYLGGSNTAQTRKDSLAATQLIFENLHEAYTNGSNLAARKNMQTAAYLAGAAFTRAYVGNIHAVAHTLGGQYSTPHGLANAVIMPYVLDAYGAKIFGRLAELAAAAGIADKNMPAADNAARFIAAIRKMNRQMGIPDKLTDLKREDIPLLAGRALKEANPLYPVPVIFGRQDMEQIYCNLLE